MFFHRLKKKKSPSGSSTHHAKTDLVGILIVNGGKDPEEGKWLDLCLKKIIQHTKWPNYRIYVWNNNIEDGSVPALVEAIPGAKLFQADPREKLAHIHAVPLQRLYEVAKKDQLKFIVTMDTDAFPVRDNWLTELIGNLNEQTVLCGVWRDELAGHVCPYVHPSCLCTTTDFIKKNRLRFDRIDIISDQKKDTLASFTIIAEKKGKTIAKLKRSNVNDLHYILGGLYGNLIYHHGAGSRKETYFWGEEKTEAIGAHNSAIKQTLNQLIFQHNDQFINWLMGNVQDHESFSEGNKLVFVLGMHRSGTSCLAGCLEVCGLYLGEVSKYNMHNQKGNQELRAVNLLHERILNRNGGAWDNPPGKIKITAQDKNDFRKILDSFPANAVSGIKDPRSLLLLERWLVIEKNIFFIATYRHPLLVAASLQKRSKKSVDEGLELWNIYNEKLIRLHKKYRFPLIKFCLENESDYIDHVAEAAIQLGLDPDLNKMRRFLSRELEHEKNHPVPVPDRCREIYAYLEKNRFAVAQESYSFHILKLKKDLLKIESSQFKAHRQ